MVRKIQEVMVIFLVSITSAFLLAFVYKYTAPIIAKNKEETLNKLLSEAYPRPNVIFKEVKRDTLWRVFKDGKFIGLVFRGEARGYSGKIRPLVGVDSSGIILKVRILKEELTETPGLGMKIVEESFLKQFEGLTKNEVWLKKEKREGKIDAITQATISSKGITLAIREGMEKFEEFLPGFKEKKFLEGSLDSLRDIYGEEVKEIVPGELWEISNNFVFFLKGEDSSNVFYTLVFLKEKVIKKLFILIESFEGKEKIKEEEILKSLFRLNSIEDLDKIEFPKEIKELGEKIEREMKNKYEQLIGRGK
ncbi:MAG: FMN-binding protein [candidate division WOR-3 bacterium]